MEMKGYGDRAPAHGSSYYGTLQYVALEPLQDHNGNAIGGTGDAKTGLRRGPDAVFEYTAGRTGTFYLAARSSTDDTTPIYNDLLPPASRFRGTYTVLVRDITTVSEPAGVDFPADETTGGRAIPDEGAVVGLLDNDDSTGESDVDWFATELEANIRYHIVVEETGDTTRAAVADVEMKLYTPDGTAVLPAGASAPGGLGYTPPAAGRTISRCSARP